MFIIARKDIFTQTKYISNIFYRQSSKNIIERAEARKRNKRKEREGENKIFAIKSVAGENVIDSRART